MTKRPKMENLLDVVRAHAENGTYVVLKHARERGEERDITDLDFEHVLKNWMA